jgi:hypothetical protein
MVLQSLCEIKRSACTSISALISSSFSADFWERNTCTSAAALGVASVENVSRTKPDVPGKEHGEVGGHAHRCVLPL